MRSTSYPITQPIVQEELPPRIREISERVKIIRFGILQEPGPSPWEKLAGMFRLGRPLNVEEMLDARGFEESQALKPR